MENNGIKSTWRNQSTQQRLITIQRKDEQRQRDAAIRRQNKPHLPFHPTNPFDTRVPTEHMPSVGQDDVTSLLGSTIAASESSASQTVVSSRHALSTGSVYTQHMPPPSQPSRSSKKHHRSQGSSTSLQIAENRVAELRKKVEEAKEVRRLQLEAEALEQELVELGQ